MAIATTCQTPAARFHTCINTRSVSVVVQLPFDLKLSEEAAKLLEANIHNAMELVLLPLFLMGNVQ